MAPLFPASATNVIGVGGTHLNVDAAGVRTTETVWSGTGSGCSVYNAAPAWQTIAGDPCGGKKAISDLSADADPGSGLAIYTTYGGTTGYWVFGGTSLSSPLIAALYTMQGGYGGSTLAGQYAWAAGTPYFDVTSGVEWVVQPGGAVHRRDRLGRPDRSRQHRHAERSARPDHDQGHPGDRVRPDRWIAAVHRLGQGPVRPDVQPAADLHLVGGWRQHDRFDRSGLFSATTAGSSFTVTAAGGGKTGTASVTVTDAPVLTSIMVSPATASVPIGGTQQFTASAKDQFGQTMIPQPTFTWSVSGGGTINPATGVFSATTAGSSFTVTAAGGGKTGTASVTVPTPDFGLAVTPGTRSVRRGSAATYTVTITPHNGFTGSVSLSLTGQPSGATVTFSPNPTTGTSTLTIGTRTTTSRGTYTLTVTGVGGGLSHSATTKLTVTK